MRGFVSLIWLASIFPVAAAEFRISGSGSYYDEENGDPWVDDGVNWFTIATAVSSPAEIPISSDGPPARLIRIIEP